MSDKIRKYVLPNLPYLFVFWFFSKIGTAYRIAPGADFGTKLMGMLDTFPKAFETYWPGLGGIDLLVGLAGAAGVYLLIQSKIKQAKKFRRDAEYGTARWGTKEDIKPFVDPKFQNNVILTGTEFLTMNTRPKIPANARNLNACVIGSSGSGKTRFWLTPQLLQAHSSYVVVDPKGGTLDQCGRFLQREKYKVRVFNSIDFSKSMHYNPLAYIKTESDVLKFVTALIANTKGDGKEGDEFWTKAETLLYCALVAYIVFEGPEEERNMNTLVEMINSMEVREDDETFKNAVDYMFDGLERRSPQHFAVRQYKKYKLASGKTAAEPDLPPLTFPSFGRSCPMTSWSLTGWGMKNRRCFSLSAIRTPPITFLWPSLSRRCSTFCVNGPTTPTADACPIMYGCCGTRRPTRDRCRGWKKSLPLSVPGRSA